MKLHVIKPSVNNMTVRVFVRAAKLDFTEDDVYGKTRTNEFLAMNPAHLTPMMEAKGLPKGVLWESCAIMQYLCNKHELTKFYPKAPAKRAMIDSAMFYLIGTLYPLLARATYQWDFRTIRVRLVQQSEASTRRSKEGFHEQSPSARCLPENMMERPSSAGTSPRRLRLAATIEFIAVIDYSLRPGQRTCGGNGEARGKAMPNPPPTARTSPIKSQRIT